jgi:hypothetical protein
VNESEGSDHAPAAVPSSVFAADKPGHKTGHNPRSSSKQCLFNSLRRLGGPRQDLNLGPMDHESAALTAELQAHDGEIVKHYSSLRSNPLARCKAINQTTCYDMMRFESVVSPIGKPYEPQRHTAKLASRVAKGRPQPESVRETNPLHVLNLAFSESICALLSRIRSHQSLTAFRIIEKDFYFPV